VSHVVLEPFIQHIVQITTVRLRTE
jgi:hypothetical protein